MTTDFEEVQTLVLRPPKGQAVRHLVLRVAPGRGGEALALLKATMGQPSRGEAPAWLATGENAPEPEKVQHSIGFTWLGLQALCLPSAYLRVFSRLAPAFAQGAPLRASRVGDTGPSSAARWGKPFNAQRVNGVTDLSPASKDDNWQLDRAHVLLTLHGPKEELNKLVLALQEEWMRSSKADKDPGPALEFVGDHAGQRLGHPAGDQGEWVHFGYRDGLSEPGIAGVTPRRAGAARVHARGEFLLGHENDVGVNRFALPIAPAEVRDFFRDSSFGVLRKMEQDLGAFDRAVDRWTGEAQQAGLTQASRQWVKAKLCGRWPGGEALHAGQWTPKDGDFAVDHTGDLDGQGCPLSSHVRRMNPGLPVTDAARRVRPLLRRGMPYGPATWDQGPDQAQSVDATQGLLGLFFCAGLEEQYEHVMGQWANRQPPHVPADEGAARDPLTGQHENPRAAMRIPIDDLQPPLMLTGFAPWTTTHGSLYAWHPTRAALMRLLDQDYLESKGEPWL